MLPSEKGLKEMRDLVVSLEHKHRGPPNDVLARAFREFIAARIDAPGVITEFQSRLLVITWKHLKEQQENLDSTDWESVFSTKNLEEVLFVLSEAKYAPQSREAVHTVARYAFHELCNNCAPEWDFINVEPLVAYVNILALHGNADEARCVAETFWWKLQECEPSPWLTVMKGFAIDGDRRQLQEVAKLLEEQKEAGTYHEELTKELIGEDHDLSVVKAMFECGDRPSPATKVAVIKYAIEKGELAWAQPIFESLFTERSAETLHATLLWEAAHGKGASEIGGIVAAWGRENRKVLDLSTVVSDLMDVANAIGKPQETAQFAMLASQWGLERNTRIRLAQLESAIQTRDALVALECCWGLAPNFHEVALENLEVMNRLIAMVSLSEVHPGDSLLDQVASLMEPFLDTGAYVGPTTAAALTRMLLRRRDLQAVSELLRPLMNSYELQEKGQIRQALIEYITDTKRQAKPEAWSAYQLLQAAFPETSVSERTDIMISFFERGENRRACLVFGHMRQDERNVTRRPSPDTYALCFEGISRVGDFDDLELVHNMLKIDMEVDVTTRIRNGLMLAYTACDMPEKGMDIFRDILQSDEGPSHRTLAIFFRMCEKHHNGTQEAIKMINKAKVLEIEIDRNMYTAFVASLAAQCEFDLAVEAVENMYSEIGESPNRDTYVFFFFSFSLCMLMI